MTQRAKTPLGVAPALALLARAAAMESRPARALRLTGAARAIYPMLGGAESSSEDWLARSAHELERARRELGEQQAAPLLVEGEAMSLDEAIAHGLSEGEPAYGHNLPRPAACLSPREREVASLAASGLSNPEIAAVLVISVGTAKRHVENILAKLGLTSRRQLKDWLEVPVAVNVEPIE